MIVKCDNKNKTNLYMLYAKIIVTDDVSVCNFPK